jgi:hypothetical protein
MKKPKYKPEEMEAYRVFYVKAVEHLKALSGNDSAKIILSLAQDLQSSHMQVEKVVALIAVLMDGVDGLVGIAPLELFVMADKVRTQLMGVNTNYFHHRPKN